MNNLLSYLFTGVSADSSERSKHISIFLGYACVAVMVMVMVLATVPGWPLAIGVVVGCALVGFIAHLIIGRSAGNGS
jgi:multidrug efflux pump subunit AcrB